MEQLSYRVGVLTAPQATDPVFEVEGLARDQAFALSQKDDTAVYAV